MSTWSLCGKCRWTGSPEPICPRCGTIPDAVPGLEAGTELGGRYVIDGLLGQGGFGITYSARHNKLGLRYAVKELFPQDSQRNTESQGATHRNSESFKVIKDRFMHEGQLLARLDHPGLVHVVDVLEDFATAYLVMELLEGPTLAKFVDDVGLMPASEVRTILMQMSFALEAVHNEGSLHRDLKPENVIMHATRGPVLIDFGSARNISEHTTDHTSLVTHGFAPPEQYQTTGAFLPATDIYGLCSIGIYALTGSVPVSALDRMMKPDVPLRIDSGNDELDTALRAGLQLDPAARPPTTAAFRVLLGVTQPDRRSGAASGFSGTVAGVPTTTRSGANDSGRGTNEPTGATGAGPTSASPPVTPRYAAGASRSRAASTLEYVPPGATTSGPPPPLEPIKPVGPVAEEFTKRRTPSLPASLKATRAPVLIGAGLCALIAVGIGVVANREPARKPIETFTELRSGPAPVLSSAASPDGSMLALAGPVDVAILDAKTGAQMQRFVLYSEQDNHVTWSPDGTQVAAGGTTGSLRVWNVKTGAEVLVQESIDGSITDVDWAPNGTIIATSHENGTLALWDVAEKKVQRRIPSGTTNADFSRDSALIATGGTSPAIAIWKVVDGTSQGTFDLPGLSISALRFSKDNARLAYGAVQGEVGVFTRATNERVTMPAGSSRVKSVEWDDADERVITTGGTLGARVWDIAGDTVDTFDATTDTTGAGFLPDGRVFTTADTPSTGVTLWSLRDAGRKPIAAYVGNLSHPTGLAWSPDGTRLAVGAELGTVPIIVAPASNEVANLSQFEGYARGLAWSPDGSRLAIASNDDMIRLYDSVGKPTIRLTAKGFAGSQSVSWSPDGERLVAASDTRAYIFNGAAASSDLILQSGNADGPTHESFIRATAWSPTGDVIASGGDDKQIHLWSVATGEDIALLEGHQAAIRGLRFSPDGAVLSSASDDRSVRLWDGKTGESIAELKGHGGIVVDVTWSTDSKLLASASADGTVIIWDAVKHQKVRSIEVKGSGAFVSVAFTPDVKTLAAGSNDGLVRLFPVAAK